MGKGHPSQRDRKEEAIVTKLHGETTTHTTGRVSGKQKGQGGKRIVALVPSKRVLEAAAF